MIKIVPILAFVTVQVVGAIRSDYGRSSNHLVVVDTDAGADDAMAISLLLSATRNSDVEVAGITCVRGNTGVQNVTKNVLRTLKVNGRLDVPVYQGSDFGLIATSPLTYYFGGDGFGDFNYPVPHKKISGEHSAIFLANIVRNNPGKVTILAIGPLTNLAVAGILYPDFYKNAKKIIFLGGSTSGIGGMDGVEFNIWGDPSAAIAVFSRSPSSNPVVIIPTETTSKLEYSWKWRDCKLGKKGTKVMNFLDSAERKEIRSSSGWKVTDQSVAAAFVNPTVVTASRLGRPHLMSNGTMFITEDGNTVRVIDKLDKNTMKLMLEELL